MTYYNEHASVIYTDTNGRQIDTFVVFETDPITGLTHINHDNLRVPASQLALHSKTVGKYHMPLEDSFSFEMLNKLKAKYQAIDEQRKTVPFHAAKSVETITTLAKAS